MAWATNGYVQHCSIEDLGVQPARESLLTLKAVQENYARPTNGFARFGACLMSASGRKVNYLARIYGTFLPRGRLCLLRPAHLQTKAAANVFFGSDVGKSMVLH